MSRPFFFFFFSFFLDFIHLFNTITLHHGQELPTLVTILIVDIKSGRAGDEAKKLSRQKRESWHLCICLFLFEFTFPSQ